MTFFRAEHLFEQKHAVLEQKQALLKAKKLHKANTYVQFVCLAHVHLMADKL